MKKMLIILVGLLSVCNMYAFKQVLPFVTHFNLIILKAKINDADTVNFIFDTGSNYSIICNAEFVQNSHLQYTKKIAIRGLGEDKQERETASLSPNNTFTFGNWKVPNNQILVLSNPIDFSQFLGFPIQGILGSDFISKYEVSVDFLSKTLTFSDTQTPLSHKGYTAVNVKILNNKPYLPISLNTNDSLYWILMDTGASNAFLLYGQEANKEIYKSEWKIPLGKGLSGDLQGYLGRAKQIQMAGIRFDSVLVALPIEVKIGRVGNVGMDFLRRFRWVLDYKKQVLWIKPYRKAVLFTPFEYNKSGIQLVAQGEHLQHIVVADVQVGSEAEKAGVQIGDIILSVNEKTTNGITLSHVTKTFQGKDNAEIRLLLSREGVWVYATLRLRKII